MFRQHRLALVVCAVLLFVVYRTTSPRIYTEDTGAASDFLFSGLAQQGGHQDQDTVVSPEYQSNENGKLFEALDQFGSGDKKPETSSKATPATSKTKQQQKPTDRPIVDLTSVLDSVSAEEDADRQSNIKTYITAILKLLHETTPNLPKLSSYRNGTHAPLKAFDDPLPYFTKEELAGYLQVNETEKAELTAKHSAFVQSLPKEPPSSKVFGGTGVVLVTGGKFLPMALASVRLIRQHTPSIPIEIFVQDESEYEKGLCENVLWPEFHVRCRVLTDYFPESFMKEYDIHQYQLKIMALLASSFDNVLLLDSDNIPIRNIEHIFTSEPFASTKYILWPDYWFRVTSPHFYDIARLEPGERIRGNTSEIDPSKIPLHDRQNTMPDKTTESGQVLVRKSAHYKSLLLALYYNVFGYNYYYPLFSQGAIGEGDKETFLAGAVALGEYPYQVKQDVRALGYHDDGFHGEGMLQADPVQDYVRQLEVSKINDVATKKKLEKEDPVQGLFAHFNMLKLNMRMMFEVEKDHLYEDSKRRRYCGSPTSLGPLVNFQDLELIMWQACQWTVCEIPGYGHTPKDWANTDVGALCEATTAHVKWLMTTHGS